MRFYTYASTMILCLEAAADAGIEFVVLDRPNPLGGERVEGPDSDPRDAVPASLVNTAPGPLVHGLTAGEMARFVNASLAEARAADRRADEGLAAHDDLGRHRPRRGCRRRRTCASPEAALAYPGIALLEGTNVSGGPRHGGAVPAPRRALAQGRRPSCPRCPRPAFDPRGRRRSRPQPRRRRRSPSTRRRLRRHARHGARTRRAVTPYQLGVALLVALKAASRTSSGCATARPSTAWSGRRSCARPSTAATPWTRSWRPTRPAIEAWRKARKSSPALLSGAATAAARRPSPTANVTMAPTATFQVQATPGAPKTYGRQHSHGQARHQAREHPDHRAVDVRAGA